MSKQIFTVEIEWKHDSEQAIILSPCKVLQHLHYSSYFPEEFWKIKVTEEKKATYKPHSFPISIETGVFLRQKKKCCNCGKELNLKYDRPDHIIPQTKMNIKIYGEELIHSEQNCQIPCQHCHMIKATWSKEKQRELMKKWEPFSKSKLRKIK